MRQAVDRAFAVVEAMLALAMAAMVVMVFGNVVMRYLLDSGIMISEEMSRFLFLWLTFIGAVVVLRRGGHLGFSTVVKALPHGGRLLCRALSGSLTLLVCLVFLWGAWPLVQVNMDNLSPVSGLPLGWAYASALLSGIGLCLLGLADLVLALRGEEPAAPAEPMGEAGA
ncbi:TRAP transporter small permease [Roseomonas harenae]|uniref:TRAP transporter small permease n=1 Tax=Muricoccus harenae TaxID=2692566 RepID=UPI0013314EAB|nr:TRAP transporter small permease [Roseomonas harenae]